MPCNACRGAVARQKAPNPVYDVIERQSSATAKCTFPNHHCSPSLCQQRFNDRFIPTGVFSNLLHPKLGARGWDFEQRAAVPVPEAPMYEDDRARSDKCNIRPAGQIASVKSKPEPACMQGFTEHQFWLRIDAADAAHV